MSTVRFKKTLFWDVDIERLNPEIDWYFIIERIAEYGDIEDFEWMRKNFLPEKISYVIKTSRALSKRTINFLKLFYEN
ncbi:MAG: hypothetical protein N2257_00975 [Thermodesulfovibrionales bacterium]|nr:hypothetical protein [Thermodesulfovibrionales bacterium]